MTEMVKTSRRYLRERAFQALFSMEFSGDFLQAAKDAYCHDKEYSEEELVEIPAFLLQLVKGVVDQLSDIDATISEHLKSKWSIERLTATDRTLLRLGLFEMLYFDETPDRVALNEIIEIAKKYSDDTSAKFINGLLSQFVKED